MKIYTRTILRRSFSHDDNEPFRYYKLLMRKNCVVLCVSGFEGLDLTEYQNVPPQHKAILLNNYAYLHIASPCDGEFEFRRFCVAHRTAELNDDVLGWRFIGRIGENYIWEDPIRESYPA